MFCYCGTFLKQNNEEIVTCHRCGIIHKSDSFKPLVTTKTYAEAKDVKHKKASSAKIKYKCVSCGNDEMSYNTIQTRSADEGQTIFYECECGHKEKLHS